MKTFHLTMVTPDGEKYNGEAESLTVRTTEGDIQILPGHIDCFGAVAIGPCRIVFPDGTVRTASAQGGFLSVKSNDVHLVTTTFEYADEIDLERAKAAMERAQEILKSEKDEAAIRVAQAKLSRALNRISVAERK